MLDERRPHPSGRPINNPKIGPSQVWRIPSCGPVLPRLQLNTTANVIGFRVERVEEREA